jgi:hypothetical protein
MERRRYLATVTAAVGGIPLAGCSLGGDGSGDESTETPTQTPTETGPLYERGTEEELILSIDAFPDGWVRDDQINENFDAVFSSENEPLVVLISVSVYEDVQAAEDGLENTRDAVSEPTDEDIGDEAFSGIQNEQIAYTVFRHSNAVCQVGAASDSGIVEPEQSTARQYAQAMYEQW